MILEERIPHKDICSKRIFPCSRELSEEQFHDMKLSRDKISCNLELGILASKTTPQSAFQHCRKSSQIKILLEIQVFMEGLDFPC
jgi:hypothetical protein